MSIDSRWYDEKEVISLPSEIKLTVYKKNSHNSSHTLLFHHGAGYTAASWNGVLRAIEQYRCIAFDARSHGDSSKGPVDIDSLVQDSLDLINHYKLENNLTLIGHSLGGAVFTRVSLVLQCPLIVIDALEELANASLRNIDSFLNARSKSFDCIEDAIKYARPKTEAAKISLINQLDKDLNWKCNLTLMRPYWSTWFTDHDKNFLRVKSLKLMVLSHGVELDKELLIAQMQGKFRLERVSSSHMVQEERPECVTALITSFVNDKGTMPYVKNTK